MNKTILKVLVAIIVSLSVGFFVGMEYKAYQVRRVLQEATKEISEVFTRESQQEEEVEQTIIEKNIGDENELATIKFKVNGVKERRTLSGSFGTPAIAKENAKFIVIDLSITNITDANFTFFPDDGFRLVDDRERQFTTYRETIGSVENYLNIRELAPSITERGFLVYEIPQDATGYGLVVMKGGTDEIYKVILK